MRCMRGAGGDGLGARHEGSACGEEETGAWHVGKRRLSMMVSVTTLIPVRAPHTLRRWERLWGRTSHFVGLNLVIRMVIRLKSRQEGKYFKATDDTQ
jgi:hypothetical protein